MSKDGKRNLEYSPEVQFEDKIIFSNQQLYVWSEKSGLDRSETAAAAKYKLFQIEAGIMGLRKQERNGEMFAELLHKTSKPAP